MILTSPDLRTLQALVGLGSIDSGKVETWLQENLDKARLECATQRDEVSLRQAQGRAQVLGELYVILCEAMELLEVEKKKQAVAREEPANAGQDAY